MRQILTCLILSLLLSGTCAFAQQEISGEASPTEEYDDHSGSEVLLSHGFLPADQMFAGGLRRKRYTNQQFSGAIALTYRYHINDIISIGMCAAFEQEKGIWRAGRLSANGNLFGTNSDMGTFRRRCFTIAPEVTFTYAHLANDLVHLYSVLGLGYTFRNEQISAYDPSFVNGMTPPPGVHFNAYASPIGIRFGNAINGFVELGLGYRGLFNYGISYHF